MILPPYLASTLYLWKVAAKPEQNRKFPVNIKFALFCGIAGSVYALWMIYAAGLKYLAAAFAFMLIGIPVYIWARHDFLKENNDVQDKKYFSGSELTGAAAIVIIAVAAICAWATGKLTI